MRRGCDTFDTGRMPGMIGASIPAAAAASRQRRKLSGEKQSCVIARVAPASRLRLRLSRSDCGHVASGCVSGYAATEMSSKEHTSDLQSIMRLSYDVVLVNKKVS